MSAQSRLPRPLAGLCTLIFLAVLIRTAWVSDDALITLRTVLNVTHGFGLTFNIFERVQTFTHPLWMFLLTGAYEIVRNIYVATFALSIGVSLVVFWLALTRAASIGQAVVAGVVLVFSRAFVDFSTSGLENPLSSLLLAVFVGVFVRAGMTPRRRLVWLATLTSLLYLTRPDNVLLVAPLLAVACYQARSVRIVARSLVVGAVPAVAWTLFAVAYYGFPFPNTAYAKLATGISQPELWSQGLLYLVDSLDRDPLTLTVIAFAVALGLARRQTAGRALAAGLLLYVAYIVSIGGDFMTGRFLAVPLFGAVVLLTELLTERLPIWTAAAALFLLVGATSAHVPLWSDSRFNDPAPTPSGIVDERAVYFQNSSLVHAQRKTFREPDWPTRGRPPVYINVLHTCGLMGSSGIEWGPYTYLLDECALADPLLSHLPAMFNSKWRTGHYSRMVPDGYEESVASNSNQLTDPGLRRYYDDIRLITRGPLWTSARWRAIVRVNTGRDAHLVRRGYYQHAGSIATLADMSAVKPDGTPGDAPGNRRLARPLAVTCDDRPGRRYLDVSLDSDDTYELTFLKGSATLDTVSLGPIPEYRRKPGLTHYTLDVPPRARSEGFDTIVIAGLSGDGHYAVGHLLVDGYGPTEPELQRRVAERDAQATGK